MSSTIRTARRFVGAASLAGAIALAAPTAASATNTLGGGAIAGIEEAADEVVSDAEESVAEAAEAVPTASDGASQDTSASDDPVDGALDPVEDAVDDVTETLSEGASTVPDPLKSGAETVAETADTTADAATTTVRTVAGVPDDDGSGEEGSPTSPSDPAPSVRSDTPQRGAASSPTRHAPLLTPAREGLPVYGRSRTYLPGLALAAPQVAPADVIADPLARSTAAAPELAPPTLASAPTGPIHGVPELPGGLATEIVVAAALLVLATGSLVYELGPQRAEA